MSKAKTEVGEKKKLLLTDNFLIEKVRYILDSPSQRAAFKALKTDEEKIRFFLEHFIMTDYAIRQMKNLYLSSIDRTGEFLNLVEDIILHIDEDH